MTLKQALEFVGNFSAPSKMPCQSYNTPATACKTGAKLAKVKNSICSQCYAMRGNYSFPVVQNAMNRRLQSIDRSEWVNAMVLAISGTEGSGFFRWHDSGDIQSLSHLEKIVAIAERLPSIKFWLPTREYSIVSEYVKKNGKFPENLIVRLSSYMIDGPAPIQLAKNLGVQTSGVSRKGFSCPANSQGNKCLACRACWDKTVETVNYKKH